MGTNRYRASRADSGINKNTVCEGGCGRCRRCGGTIGLPLGTRCAIQNCERKEEYGRVAGLFMLVGRTELVAKEVALEKMLEEGVTE